MFKRHKYLISSKQQLLGLTRNGKTKLNSYPDISICELSKCRVLKILPCHIIIQSLPEIRILDSGNFMYAIGMDIWLYQENMERRHRSLIWNIRQCFLWRQRDRFCALYVFHSSFSGINQNTLQIEISSRFHRDCIVFLPFVIATYCITEYVMFFQSTGVIHFHLYNK